MTSEVRDTFRCGVNQGYTTVPFFSKWSFTCPFMNLELDPDVFVLRPVRFFRWFRKPLRIRYEAVSDASVSSDFPPHIRLRLADAGQGVIHITSPNEGVLDLANRLEVSGVPVRRLNPAGL